MVVIAPIVPNGDDLLLAFAKLDGNGRGYFPTREAYLNSLTVIWSEIHKYYRQKDVCIPVLGGGITSIGETTPTQQELVDLIIESYYCVMRTNYFQVKDEEKFLELMESVCSGEDELQI